MSNKRNDCKLLSLILTLTLLIGVSRGMVVRAESSDIDKSWMIDLSVFKLDPDADKTAYVEGLLELLTNFNNYSSKVIGEQAFNIGADEYYKYSNYLQYQEVSKYLNDPKYKVKEVLDEYAKENDEVDSINSKYEQLLTFGDTLREFYEKTLSGEIDAGIKEISKTFDEENKIIASEAEKRAKEMDQSGEDTGSDLFGNEFPQDADVYFKKINYYIDGVLLNLGSYKPAEDKKAEIAKTIVTLNESREKAQTPVLNILDNIKFSSTPIVPGKTSDKEYKTTFSGSENIYGVANFTNGIKTALGSNAKTVTIEGAEYITLYAQCMVDMKQNNYTSSKAYVYIKKADYNSNKASVPFEIMPDPTKSTALNLNSWYDVIYPILKSGKNNVRIQLDSDYEDRNYIARGEFVLNWSDSDKSKVTKKVAAAVKRVEDNQANIRKLPGYFKQKHVPYKDASLSDTKIKELVKKKFPNLKNIIKIVNLDGKMGSEWMIEKNDYGIPTEKISSHYTWLLYEAKDGWCYYTEIKFVCTYKGGGKYGSPYIFIKDAPIKISKKNAVIK
ncbi:MAG TPA: hypothetical protein VIO64_14020 [Pseudobacteroides sp.]|uniref:hypothetical protein n=1 Tax=Pseudobacteroides sp. TaxID=1968840 RepID=UPI002F95A97C